MSDQPDSPQKMPNHNLDQIRAALNISDINAKDSFGTTALHLAVNYGQKEVVKLLLDEGSLVNEPNNAGNTAFHATTGIKTDDKQAIIDLLIDKGANIDAADHYGQTVMHLEARWGTAADLAYLIGKGCNIEARDNYGATALHYAVFAENAEAVKVLLQAGANSDARDNSGKSVLDWARSNDQIVNLIENNNLLKGLKEKQPISYLEECLFKGASADAVEDGFYALHYALNHPQVEEVLQLLFRYNVHADFSDPQGRTALQQAAIAGNIKAMDILINHGCRLNSRDHEGKSALELAEEYQQGESVLFLKRKGAKGSLAESDNLEQEQPDETTDKSGSDGRTALHQAIEDNHLQIINLLKQYGAQ